jgi:predicted RNA-binding Zn-ribbon protein involved in translation (DUF1610 family)
VSDQTQVVVDVDARPEEAERLAEPMRAWLVAEGVVAPGPARGGGRDAPGPRWTRATGPGADPGFLGVDPNGVEVVAERRVWDAGENGIALRCASCGEAFEPGEEWSVAVGAWAEGDGAAAFGCPRCGASASLQDWRGDWPWGFGALGIQFWNWPPLSQEFVTALAARLGHRVVVVRSRL